ncbi:MAG TPA: hypothetical protein VK849_15120, partial [Longimicrobiales bacterium]|nr:hypothetical protein [Longimicrobiales bacterium]
FMDVRGRAWLAAAGAAAGIATLFKVVGLYFLAACLLSVAWRRLGTGRGHRAVAAVGCGLFLVALGRLVLPGAAVSAVVLFFLPAAAVCAAVTVRRHGTAASWRTALLLDGAWLVAGFLAPVALFLAPYAVRGGVAAWLDGVLLRPALRLEAASSAPPAAWTLLTGAAAVVLVALGERLGGEARTRAAAGAAVALAVGLALDDALDGAVMASLWYSLRTFVPALVVWGAWRHARGRGSGAAFATLATVALWTLVQFPYPAPAYAFYVAPLAVLATLAVVAGEPSDAGAPAPARHGRPGGPGRPFSPLLALVAGVYAFRGAGYVAGVVGSGEVPLPGDRGGILVSSEDVRVYGGLMETVAAHVSGGALWAGPDAPEVYFLTGLPNRTPILYEFLTDTNPAEPAALSDGTVTVAVVNTRPLFSRPLEPNVLERLTVRFSDARQVGPFVVRWRSP